MSIVELYLQVLIEGLYEFAATAHQRSTGSALKEDTEYYGVIARFHLGCMGALGLGNDPAVCLTTYRAMQHCGVIPLDSNLFFGAQQIAANICVYDDALSFQFVNRPYLLKLRNFVYWIFSWLMAVVCCLVLQSSRKQNMSIRLSFGSPDEIRLTFEQWVAIADKVADYVDQVAEHPRPISQALVGPGSEWRNKNITGIWGGGYAMDLFMLPFMPAAFLWKSWQFLKRKFTGSGISQ